MRGVALIGGSIVAAVLSACESTGSLSGPSVIGFSVSVSPRFDTIFVTDTIQEADTVHLVATVRSIAVGIVDRAVFWSSSSPSVAAVDGDGVVTALAPGETTITADIGGKTSTARVSVIRVNAITTLPLTRER